MTAAPDFEIFMVAPPGLEDVLCAEAIENGFAGAVAVPGGVVITGGWADVWRANLVMRGATRILARVGEFMAFHLAQLDKRARKFPWGEVLRADVPVRVEVVCKRSKIYHAGAAAQRIERALQETAGITVSALAEVSLKLRIEDNKASLSVDTSGEALHRRGHKLGVGKAPLRENLAALFLRRCGYDGTGPVIDPMCGSGTFVIEAAEIAAGLLPGRSRGFAFEKLSSFDAEAWQAMRAGPVPVMPSLRFQGYDRDQGAVRTSAENAARAGVGEITSFGVQPISDLARPQGPPGLVMVNPPYGGRIGNKKLLYPLYGTLGQVLRERFRGWRVGMVTSEPPLAKATRLPFLPQDAPVPHGGLKVRLYQTGALT